MTTGCDAMCPCPGRSVPDLLIRSGDGCWLHFRDPVRIIRARGPSDVRECLKGAGTAARDGAWVAGYVDYEASSGLDPSYVTHGSGTGNVAWFGVFDEPERLAALPPARGACKLGKWTPNPSREGYLRSAGRALDYIRAGDTYQVNLSIRLRASFEGDPWTFFLDLWRAQPTPYAAFMSLPDRTICSVSPELFFESDGRTLRSRPMKGTARRGLTCEDDARREAELFNSAKNRAENVMIVDMIRNDLGRLADPGSVVVASLFDVERHFSVFQMTSTVECRSGAGLGEVFEALFPCSSITGAPKVRTMQIIRELEPDPRGIYCGAIGVAHGRSMRFSVAIRTVSINAAEGIAEYGTGGGIVFESTPEAEFEECLQKARVLADRIPEFALLETLRWSMEEGYHLLESHLARMSASASYFGIRLDPPSVRRSLDELAATLGPEPCKVRLTVSADGRPAVEVSPLPAPGEARVALAAGPIDASDRFLYHKTTRRAVYDAARSGRENVEDVILFNGSREVTETTIANIVVEIDGRMVTPPVSCGLLPGTMRARLLEDGLVTERTVRVEELESADRIWLVNSVRGWRRAVLVRD